MAAAGIGVLGCEQESLLPHYAMDQTDSSHPGYRRTTLTSGSTVYVSDYEEYPFQSMSMTFTDVVGHVGSGEDRGDVAAVDGQDPNSYVVINEGMYPDGIYRNIKTPPFNWRTAKFQTMGFAHPVGPGAQKTTTDPALINEVLSVLRDGSTVTLPVSVNITNADLGNLLLTSKQLPGLYFGPFVYMDKTGGIYLTYHVAVPEWRAAGPLLSKWVTAK